MNTNKTRDSKRVSVFTTVALSVGIAICVCTIALLVFPILIINEIAEVEWIAVGSGIVHSFAVFAGGIILGNLINKNKYIVLCCYAFLYFMVLIGIGMLFFILDFEQLQRGVLGIGIGVVFSIILLKLKKNSIRINRAKCRYR